MEIRKVQLIIAVMSMTCCLCSCEQYKATQNLSDTEASSITEEEAMDASSTIENLAKEYIVLFKEIANINLELDHMFGRIQSNNQEFNNGKANKSVVIELKHKIQSLKKYVEELKRKAGKYEDLVTVVETLSRSLAEKEREINRLYHEIDTKNSQIEALVEELRIKNALLEKRNRELEESNRRPYITTGDALIDAFQRIPKSNKGLFKGRLSKEIEVCKEGLLDKAIEHYNQAIQLGSKDASVKKTEALKLLQKTKAKSKQPAIQDDVYY